MIVRTLKTLSTSALLAGALSACAPSYSTPHGGPLPAETARANQDLYRTADGRVFPTRAARDAYLRLSEAQRNAEYEQDLLRQGHVDRTRRAARREAQSVRQQRRLDQIERERTRAERRREAALRAERQARREAQRTRRASQARDREQALVSARRNADRAEQAAIRAERRAERLARQNKRINRRQQRVDNLAPRPRLSTAVRKKIKKYAHYRRPGENVPAFVTRIAAAERSASREGQSVAWWLNSHNRGDGTGSNQK